MKCRLVVLIILSILVSNCHHSTINRSFYYWRTTFKLSLKEERYLTDLNVHSLYLRLFDVDWDETRGSAVPLGKISFIGKPSAAFEFIPVVYIVNKTLQKTPSGVIPDLATKILNEVQSLMSDNHLKFKELQIDCDWTESTHYKYFHLLSTLRSELERNKQIISATIRLHQVKYAVITGIPPVHQGMLMYYNMGKIEATAKHNSIYNKEDAAKYVNYVSKYPLPLDIALPSFAWGVHVRNDKVVELLNHMTSADFKNNTNFNRTDSLQFIADSSFFYRGFYFMKNDRIKIEEVSPELCLQAAQQLAGKLKNGQRSVAIFQIDSLMIKKYEEKELEEIFDSFH